MTEKPRMIDYFCLFVKIVDQNENNNLYHWEGMILIWMNIQENQKMNNYKKKRKLDNVYPKL